jgi:hypothetical protein
MHPGRPRLAAWRRTPRRTGRSAGLEQSDEPIPPTVTDEELILRAWRQWGEAGLAKLLGDFSFALWDETVRQLWCVRDLIGAQPFFYAQSGDGFYSNTPRCDSARRYHKSSVTLTCSGSS